jgi:hypothetical protein
MLIEGVESPLISILIKSFAPDYNRAVRLVSSIVKHNKESIPVWIVVPERDLDLFSNLKIYPWIEVIPEESFPCQFAVSEIKGIRPGYINQEIVKLAFAEFKKSKFYLCVDSDGIFISDFKKSDFVSISGLPYTVLVEDKDLKSDGKYYTSHWKHREELLNKILEILPKNNNGEKIKTCHGFQLLSCEYLEMFRDEVMAPRDWNYIDLISWSPYEFSWYNYYLQVKNLPHHAIEPYFKTIHTLEQYIALRISNSTVEDIGRSYLGLVVNSNFFRNDKILTAESGMESVLGEYLTIHSLLKIVGIKIGMKIMRFKMRFSD